MSLFEALARDVRVSSTDDTTIEDILSANEALLQSIAELDAADAAFEDLKSISSTIDDLEHLSDIVALHGVTQSLLAFTNRDQLLSSAFPAVQACESLGHDVAADSDEAAAVHDALQESVESLVGDFFKKAWDVVVSVGTAVGNFAVGVATKVADAVKWVAGKVWNAAKAAVEFVVSHPIASILGLLAATGGVLLAVNGVWAMPFPTTLATLGEWQSTIVTKIGGAFGSAWKGVVSLVPEGLKFGKEIPKQKGIAEKLGFSKENWTKVTGGVTGIFSKDGYLCKSAAIVATKAKGIVGLGEKKEEEGASVARRALTWLLKITKEIWEFISKHIGGAATSVIGIFRNFFTPEHGDTPEAKKDWAAARKKARADREKARA